MWQMSFYGIIANCKVVHWHRIDTLIFHNNNTFEFVTFIILNLIKTTAELRNLAWTEDSLNSRT